MTNPNDWKHHSAFGIYRGTRYNMALRGDRISYLRRQAADAIWAYEWGQKYGGINLEAALRIMVGARTNLNITLALVSEGCGI